MEKPFLTVFTRTCRRPKMLSNCIKSVVQQSNHNIEQVFVLDTVGKHPEGNILWANKQFSRFADRVDGDYVFCLDDDGMFINVNFVESLNKLILEESYPDVVLLKTLTFRLPGNKSPYILPEDWLWKQNWEVGITPDMWAGNGYCICTRSDVWKQFVKNYHHPHGGDWHYVTSLIRAGCRFVKLDICASTSTQRGKGVVFEDCKPSWFIPLVRHFGIDNVGNDDWRLRLWKKQKS